MHRIFFCFLITLMLSGCSIFQIHRPDIEQGNVITPEMVQNLHPGMSEAAVKETMGTPMMLTIFSPNRVEYVYTFQTGHEKRIEKRVTCLFSHGRLVYANVH